MISRLEQAEQLCAELRSVSHSGARQLVEDEMRRILESKFFSSSHRSSRFLQHVVERALACEFDSLKERILGIDLFGRSSDFDTDHDSVVRVAASDVRKRLRDFYRAVTDSSIRIELPPGLYIPHIDFLPERAASRDFPPAPAAAEPGPFPWRILAFASTAAALLMAASMLFHPTAISPAAPRPVPPPLWSALFKSGRTIDVVPADANLVIAKARSRQDVPIESYTNHSFRYAGDLTGPGGAYLNDIPLTTVSDAALAARISDLTGRFGAHAQVRSCSRLDFSELKGDVPVVLLGSPMSNPWTQLLYDQLDFQVVHRFESGFDVCVNRHPHSGESSTYVPTLHRQGFSEGYAIITMVPNLTGRAPVLIIAGTSTEGTEAAGEFVTNIERLAAALQRLGVDRQRSARKLELLIRLSFVSSASAQSEIIASRIEY